MKEPIPSIVTPPAGKETTVSIGIVLKDDKLREIDICFPDDSYTLAAHEHIRLAAKQGYKIKIQNTALTLLNSEGHVMLKDLPELQIQTSSPKFEAKSGIAVSPIRAGRNFHWEKSIEATLPGSLRVLAEGGSIQVINQLPFEEYIACVIASEMGSACPVDFIKSQAIAARSWAFCFLQNKHPECDYEICNDDDCQRYQGSTYLTPKIINAVRECRGEFLVDQNGNICPAYYSKSCGGHTEDAINAFELDVPSCRGKYDAHDLIEMKLDLTEESDFETFINDSEFVSTQAYCSSTVIPEDSLKKYLGSVDDSGNYYRWSYSFTHNELLERLKGKLGLKDAAAITHLEAGERGISGRVLKLGVYFLDPTKKPCVLWLRNQYEIRTALHESFL